MEFIELFKTIYAPLVGPKEADMSTKDYLKKVYNYAYEKVGFVEFNDIFADALKDVLRTHEDYSELTAKEKKEILLTNCQRIDDEALVIMALNALKDDLT